MAGAVCGLAVFFAVAKPTVHSNASATTREWLALLAVATAVIGIALASGRITTGAYRAMLFGLAAACAEAMMAVIAEAFGHRLRAGVWSTVASWQPYAVAVCGVVTLLLVQSAYQVGVAAATLPVLTVAEPIIAISIGIALFDERMHLSGWRGPIAVTSLALAIRSLVLIARTTTNNKTE